jgi:uncharacterized protein (DUF2236 family)
VDGYFDDTSMLRRVHREWVVALSGPRALLIMATHPVAFAGFFAHTGSLDDPYERLRRTAQVMDAIAWGPRDEADRLSARVRQMHARVEGELRTASGRFPKGTPYRADDPALLLWIIAALVDSALTVYQQYVTTLTDAERDVYWQDYKVVGRHFGLTDADLPASIEDFDAYVDAMLGSGDLHVDEQARQLAIEIVLKPPVPLLARPLVELVNQITVGLLPDEVRRLYRFRWDPVRGLARAVGAEYTKRILLPLVPRRARTVPQAR